MRTHFRMIESLPNSVKAAVLSVCLFCSLAAPAQTKEGADPADLDFGTNLAVPEIPEKQSVAVKTHMYKIGEALQHNGFQTSYFRNGEVVLLTMPCSELFAPNDTVLKAGGQNKLRRLSKLLQYPTMYKVVVAVYSDDTGEPEYSDGLTSVRANAIEAELTGIAAAQGVQKANVIPYGLGQADPKVDNNSIDNRAVNRRAEIYIIPEWEMIKTAKSRKLN